MHALIVGPRGVGKSTLIRRVLQELDRTLFGYETKKENHLADEVNGSPIYIYEAGREHVQRGDNLLGYCKNHHFTTLDGAFDRYAPRLLEPVPADCVIELDEIGFMEGSSVEFCRAVLSLLDGDIPIIAGVKDKDFPFLQTVRNHPKARCFYMTPENRDERYDQVLAFMKAQWEEK